MGLLIIVLSFAALIFIGAPFHRQTLRMEKQAKEDLAQLEGRKEGLRIHANTVANAYISGVNQKLRERGVPEDQLCKLVPLSPAEKEGSS